MTREELIEVMARAMLADELTQRPTFTFDPAWKQESDIWLSNACAALSALEAAGVRLIEVRLTAIEAMLIETVTALRLRDMLERSQIAYVQSYIEAEIRPAIRKAVTADLAALAASPYASQKEQTHESD